MYDFTIVYDPSWDVGMDPLSLKACTPSTEIPEEFIKNNFPKNDNFWSGFGSSFFGTILKTTSEIGTCVCTDVLDIYLSANGIARMDKKSENEDINQSDSNLEIQTLDTFPPEDNSEEAQELSLDELLNQCAESFTSSFTGAIENLSQIINVLNPIQKSFFNSLKNDIALLSSKVNDGNLFTQEESNILIDIRHKIETKIQLSNTDIENLIIFSEKQAKLDENILDVIKNITKKMVQDHSYISKNFVSLIGASIAGTIAGPTAAFATHQAIGGLWRTYVNDKADPQNRMEKVAMLLVNGVVGSTIVGTSTAIACAISQAIQEEAPIYVREGFAAASLGYLEFLAGTSPMLTLKIGLFGLMLLKGRQIVTAIKNDSLSAFNTIKNPRRIPSNSLNFITKIAKDSFAAFAEKKWIEMTALVSVVVIPLSSLVLGSPIVVGLATAFAGIYLMNRTFHSAFNYDGKSEFTNENFRKWVTNQLQEFSSSDEQIDTLKSILKSEMGESFSAKSLDKILSNPEVRDVSDEDSNEDLREIDSHEFGCGMI